MDGSEYGSGHIPKRGLPPGVTFTAEEKRRAISLLWRIEEQVYDATTERPFFDFKHEWDECDNAIIPLEPQTDAGWAAYTDILLTMREAES
jgi:hypothetical protein